MNKRRDEMVSGIKFVADLLYNMVNRGELGTRSKVAWVE
jgi:hypothetical protein